MERFNSYLKNRILLQKKVSQLPSLFKTLSQSNDDADTKKVCFLVSRLIYILNVFQTTFQKKIADETLFFS